MAYRLKSREKFIPNGFRFTQPETGWQSQRMASFSTIVNALISHRTANPHLVQKHNWATDYENVANEVDAFNANICASMGWKDYISSSGGDVPPPKSKAPSAQEQSNLNAAAGHAKKIWAGVRTNNDWAEAGWPAVTPSRSESRAAVCAVCPKNGQGDFTRWFTQPASDVIKRQVEEAQQKKMTTGFDSKLNICEVCLCPLKLKVHTPIEFIKPNMPDAVLAELERVTGCWVAKEVRES